MGIWGSVLLEKTLDELHPFENFLFLETSSDDLHADRQAVHIVGVVTFIGICFDLVPWLERPRELIERAVHAGNGKDARRVIQLQRS
jgi:hypothetical protein